MLKSQLLAHDGRLVVPEAVSAAYGFPGSVVVDLYDADVVGARRESDCKEIVTP